jgi:hypothetical protein
MTTHRPGFQRGSRPQGLVGTESAMLPKPPGTDESRPVSFTQEKRTETL